MLVELGHLTDWGVARMESLAHRALRDLVELLRQGRAPQAQQDGRARLATRAKPGIPGKGGAGEVEASTLARPRAEVGVGVEGVVERRVKEEAAVVRRSACSRWMRL